MRHKTPLKMHPKERYITVTDYGYHPELRFNVA
jgi:hypothetical protein